MSTRSYISFKHSDGSITAVYCHSDGYPEGVGATLAEHYSSEDSVKKLLQNGDISVLEKSCDKPEGHSFERRVKGYTVYYGRDRGEDDCGARTFSSEGELFVAASRSGAEYLYLFSEGKWKYSDCMSFNFRPLEK